MNTAEYMTNGEGHLVPVDKVKPEDKIEDEVVTSLFEKAQELHAELAAFKALAFGNVESFLDLLGQEYNVSKGGKKGNITLTSYDGLRRIQVAVQDYIDFGAQLQIAKQLIDECIHDWSNGANVNLKSIVDHAFRVDKNNRLNTQAILGLRRLSITDDKWLKAMEAISNSIRVTSSKQYVRFYYRAHTGAEFTALTLDIAKV